jgi:hypothetical protein
MGLVPTLRGANGPFRASYVTGRRAAVVLGLMGLALWGCALDEQSITAPPPCDAVVGGQLALDSALAVHRRHTMRLIEIPGVVGTGVGLTADCRPAIKISTKEAGVVGLPDELEGIPVEVRVTGEVIPLLNNERRSENGVTKTT